MFDVCSLHTTALPWGEPAAGRALSLTPCTHALSDLFLGTAKSPKPASHAYDLQSLRCSGNADVHLSICFLGGFRGAELRVEFSMTFGFTFSRLSCNRHTGTAVHQ